MSSEVQTDKLKFRIHFEQPDGTEDSFIVTGFSLEEIRAEAQQQVEWRHGRNPWSEDVS